MYSRQDLWTPVACVLMAMEANLLTAADLYQRMELDLGHPLKATRRSALWACPFHKETTRGAFGWFDKGGARYGFKCFSCGVGGHSVIDWIAKYNGIDYQDAIAAYTGDDVPLTPVTPQVAPPPSEPRAIPSWLHDAERIVAEYANHPRALSLWQEYRPLDAATIQARELGYGVLPWSQCKHPRLTIPLRYKGAIVGMRGRALECGCKKWLQSTAHPEHSQFLYNVETLRGARGGLVLILENAADALLLEQRYPQLHAVATFGVTNWRPAWSRWLEVAGVALALIGYDNDPAGCPNAAQRRAAWDKARAQGREAYFAGLETLNKIRAAGYTGQLKMVSWHAEAAAKTDIGEILMRSEQ